MSNSWGQGRRGGGVTGAVYLDSMSTGGQGHTETHPICVSAHRSSLPKARCPENTGREAGGGDRGRAEEAPILPPPLSTMEHLDQHTCPPLVAGVPAKFTQIERMAYPDI